MVVEAKRHHFGSGDWWSRFERFTDFEGFLAFVRWNNMNSRSVVINYKLKWCKSIFKSEKLISSPKDNKINDLQLKKANAQSNGRTIWS